VVIKYIFLGAFVLSTILAWPAVHSTPDGSLAWAAEQRCTDLGANCICSEPLNTASYTFLGSDIFHNPADSTTKECTASAGIPTGYAVIRPNDIIGANDSVALSALPAGNSVTRFLRVNTTVAAGHVDQFAVGNSYSQSSTFLPRFAARWYNYYTSTFQFKGQGSCENLKLGGLGGFSSGDQEIDVNPGGDIHYYNFLDWSPSRDCCSGGPGGDGNLSQSSYRGKWWRFEVVIDNRVGPNYRLRFYGRNITDNDPELLILDTNGSPLNGAGTPPTAWGRIHNNNYRQNVCQGWIGVSHYMMAGWSTNTGQRIGAASEIEAGGAPSPPAAPTNLRLLASILLVIFGAGSFACIIMGASTWMARRAAHGRSDGGMGDLGSREVPGPVLPPVGDPLSPPDREGWRAVDEGSGAASKIEALVAAARGEARR